ncbi:MAG TPA: hypothetical protein VF635_15125 [Propionibacteriaceae bacterium]
MKVLVENTPATNVLSFGHDTDCLRVTNMGDGLVVDQVDPATRKMQRVTLTRTGPAAMLIWLS